MSLSVSSQETRLAAVYYGFLPGLFFLTMYVSLFTFLYVNNIYPKWGYFGFRLSTDNEASYMLGVACVFAAYLFLPRRAKMASDYILWLLFILALVPIQVTFGLSNSINDHGYLYQIFLLISFAISSLLARSLARLRLLRTREAGAGAETRTAIRRGTIRKVFILFSVLAVVALVLRFSSIMSFAGIEDIYEQRKTAQEFGIGTVFGYLILWTTYLTSPLIFAMGLVERKKHLIFLAVAMLISIYMITAAKSIFVIIALGFFIHALNKLKLPERMYLLFALPTVPIILLISLDFSQETRLGSIVSYVIEQMVIRGLAIQAMIFNLYVEFFSQNPFTYYSHVTGISSIIKYPYELPVGRVISVYQYGHPNANANSGIWSTDGVAAAGPVGIIIVGFLLGAFLGFTNRMTKGVDHAFLSIAMTPLVMLMVNVSMFTTLASGGGFLLVMLVRWLWRDVKPTNSPSVT